MEEYLKSKKYIILLVVVCLLFAVMISNFINYLPQPINNEKYESNYRSYSDNNQQTINQADDSYDDTEAAENESDDEDDDEPDSDNEHKTGHIDYMQQSYPDIQNIEEIPAPKGSAEENVIAE